MNPEGESQPRNPDERSDGYAPHKPRSDGGERAEAQGTDKSLAPPEGSRIRRGGRREITLETALALIAAFLSLLTYGFVAACAAAVVLWAGSWTFLRLQTGTIRFRSVQFVVSTIVVLAGVAMFAWAATRTNAAGPATTGGLAIPEVSRGPNLPSTAVANIDTSTGAHAQATTSEPPEREATTGTLVATELISTADWDLHDNPELPITFFYPAEWEVVDTGDIGIAHREWQVLVHPQGCDENTPCPEVYIREGLGAGSIREVVVGLIQSIEQGGGEVLKSNKVQFAGREATWLHYRNAVGDTLQAYLVMTSEPDPFSQIVGQESQMMMAAYAAPNDQYAMNLNVGAAILSTIRLRPDNTWP